MANTNEISKIIAMSADELKKAEEKLGIETVVILKQNSQCMAIVEITKQAGSQSPRV